MTEETYSVPTEAHDAIVMRTCRMLEFQKLLSGSKRTGPDRAAAIQMAAEGVAGQVQKLLFSLEAGDHREHLARLAGWESADDLLAFLLDGEGAFPTDDDTA